MATKTTSKPAAKRKPQAAANQTGAKLDGAVLVETPKRSPTHDEIAFRAFELSQRRAHGEGGALNDWLAAEQELRAS